MATRRSYGSYNDGCAAAHALDLVGERWTLIVVRELLLGPKRFSDLQRDVLGIGPATLAQRLRDLERHGIVHRRPWPGPGRAEVYEVTGWGQGLETVNNALSAWAVASPAMPFEADMSPDTLVLAMRAHARATAGERDQIVSLALTDTRRAEGPRPAPVTYRAHLTDRGTTVVRDDAPGPTDAQIQATTGDWKACVIAGAQFEERPQVTVAGDHAAARRLLEATALRVDA